MGNSIFPREWRADLPFKWQEEMEILGVTFDERLCFRAHIQRLLGRAKVRHSVMSKLARSSWGLETGVLRVTHEALLTSLIRYGMVATGSGAYESDFCLLQTRHANIAARRVLGIGRSARLGTLFATSNALSARNLYLRSCATMLDRCLRATDSSTTKRLHMWSKEQFQVTSWTPVTTEVAPANINKRRRGHTGFWEIDIAERWTCELLREIPVRPDWLSPSSTYHTDAAEINADPELKAKTFNFDGVGSWMDTGMKLLSAIGWRPDCTKPAEINLKETLPPKCGKGREIIIGSVEFMEWQTEMRNEAENDSETSSKNEDTAELKEAGPAQTLDIRIKTFFGKGYGYSCAYMASPDGGISTHGWLFGWVDGLSTPVYVHEFAILHACTLAEEYIEEKGALLKEVRIRAGRELDCARLLGWFNESTVGLASAEAGPIMGKLDRLAGILPCPLNINCQPEGDVWGLTPMEIDDLRDPISVIAGEKTFAKRRLGQRPKGCSGKSGTYTAAARGN